MRLPKWWPKKRPFYFPSLADDALMTPGRSWPHILGMALLAITGWSATVVISVCPPGLLRTAGSATIGGYIALVVMGAWKRMRAYKRGWIMGRAAMIHSLVETGKRGMTINDWLQAEAEKDMVLMGVTPPQRPQWNEDQL